MPSITAALVGNPNAGKTTLFNRLTGANQHVGNWPGVTVERHEGVFIQQQAKVSITDLPGTYSLTTCTNTAIDQQIVADYVLAQQPDVFINVVDASHLTRHLYLTTQLLSMQVPLMIALNMSDVAKKQGIEIDIPALAQALGCPVIPITASKGQGIDALKDAIAQYQPVVSHHRLDFPLLVQQAQATLVSAITQAGLTLPEARYEALALCLLECDNDAHQYVDEAISALAKTQIKQLSVALGDDPDVVIADTRYRFIDTVYTHCVDMPKRLAIARSRWIDRILLNRFWGLPLFFMMMYLLFVVTLGVGSIFQDCFDIASSTLFVSGVAYSLHAWHCPDWIVALLANGMGRGVNTVFTFVPVIGALFFCLSFLEDCGYMARAAFVIDRAMRYLGLSGKSFVPMLIGFGCNVPAVMATRTLSSSRERILTILMMPFMSCGARLAIYAVFVSAFFKQWEAAIIFALYMTGILAAVVTGWILRKTLLQGSVSPLVMELPPYHMPQIQVILKQTWRRLWRFISRAGRVIVPVCMMLGLLSSINLQGQWLGAQGSEHALLAAIGRWLTPLLAPMGIHTDNWPATVGLLTGVLAKEVVIGTLDTLYGQMGHAVNAMSALSAGFNVWAGLTQAVLSIRDNFIHLMGAWHNPMVAMAPMQSVSQHVYSKMAQLFDGKIGIFAYLLFILLYFPCVSTTAVIVRELHWRWANLAMLWSTGMAYGIATLFYQTATVWRHWGSSLMTISIVVLCFTAAILMIRRLADDVRWAGVGVSNSIVGATP